MKNELILKIQILESLAGKLRREYGFTLESDEIFSLLAGAREEIAEQKALDAKEFTKVGKAILLDIAMGPGAELPSRKDTLWGCLNGVTHYVDHTAGRQRDSALTSAWFGQGADLKQRAFDLAVETLAARR